MKDSEFLMFWCGKKKTFLVQNLLCNTRWTDGMHNPFVERLLVLCIGRKLGDKLGSSFYLRHFQIAYNLKDLEDGFQVKQATLNQRLKITLLIITNILSFQA